MNEREECIEIEAKGIKMVVDKPNWKHVLITLLICSTILGGMLIYLGSM